MGKRILIVDTSTVIIQRLRDLISESLDIDDIDISVSYQDASKKIINDRPDIVLLDLGLAANNSNKLLREIKKENSKISVIAISDTPDERIKEQCIRAGANYFFDKYNEFEKIPGAIQKIISGV